MNILVIEDQSLMLETILQTVKSVYPEASLYKSSNISEGKKLLNENPFDLVITDLDFDGEKRFAIAEEAQNQNVPCIIFSAHCNESFIERAKEFKVRSYVCKLGDINEFRYALSNYRKISWWVCSVVQSKIFGPNHHDLVEPDLRGAEEKIIQLMLLGKERSEIAKILKVKKSSVYNYINKMIQRNDCSLEQLIHRYLTWKKA